MTARELMAAADALTGVYTGMSAVEIREAQARATIPVQKAKYLVDKYKRSRTSQERGELWEAMVVLGGQNPEVISLIKHAFPDRVFAPRAVGRPRR